MKYRYFLGEEALASFAAASRSECVLLTQHFQHVADFPYDHDVTWNNKGFDYCEKRFGRWMITYRVDGAVNHVLILEIAKLNRR